MVTEVEARAKSRPSTSTYFLVFERSKSSLRERYRDNNNVHPGDEVTKTQNETDTQTRCQSPSQSFLKREQLIKPTVIRRESLFANLVCT